MMNQILALIAVLAISCFGSSVFAAHEMADVDKPSPSGTLQVYGAAKLSVDMIDTGSKATYTDKNLNKVSSNSSRLGFKGSEDLKDGLSAVYQVELGINMDGTTTTVSNATTTARASTTSVNSIGMRNSYLGLKHSAIGTVLLGTHDTPYKTSTLQFDPFGDTMGDGNAILGNIQGDANFDLRPKDVIAYVSPNWGGVQVSLAKVQTGKEVNNDTATGHVANSNAYSAAVMYNAGPLAVALAYEVHTNVATSWDAPPKMKNTGTKVGAGYTIGDTKIGLVYEAIEDDNVNTIYSRNALYASIAHKIGKETIKLAYGKAEDGDNPLSKTGATMMAVGVDHTFSKRTTVFVVYAATDNEKDATYGLGQGGAGGAHKPAVADEDPSVISFGMTYSF